MQTDRDGQRHADYMKQRVCVFNVPLEHNRSFRRRGIDLWLFNVQVIHMWYLLRATVPPSLKTL